ncbi:MAG: DUF3795 domain-containing protein [Phycisphaerales bacterium]|nr:MAG: DUF3795 domain-containing protein [Phycisphaerales bacterium]
MSAMMAYCGLECETCPIYLATREKNKEEQARMRAEIAQVCRQDYGMDYGPDDITDCDGCRTEGERLFSGCKDCAIRNCAKARTLASCAHCSDYACEKLEAFFAKEPDARTRLDQTRADNA